MITRTLPSSFFRANIRNASKPSRLQASPGVVNLLLSFSFLALAVVAVTQAATAQVQTKSVASRDGVRIVYDVRGSGDTTLLFVHCWACDRFFWRDQADAFADRYQVVTLDLAGHGESGKDRKQWSILGLSEDVRAVADALNLRRIILVGHSMGGPVSLEAARLLRGRVLGAILVDTIHDVEVRRSVESAQADAARMKADFAGYMGDLSPIFSKTSDPSIRHWVEQKAMSADPLVAIALKLDTPNLDLKKLFVDTRVPIRAINAKPPLSNVTNIQANKKYADYDVSLMENAGHFLQLEHPKKFNELLAKWIAALSK